MIAKPRVRVDDIKDPIRAPQINHDPGRARSLRQVAVSSETVTGLLRKTLPAMLVMIVR